MRVVKINKIFRNGSKEHFLVVEDGLPLDEVDYFVECWCESEHSGSNYGYVYDWNFVEDEAVIKEVLLDELDRINSEIDSLELRKNKISNFLGCTKGTDNLKYMDDMKEYLSEELKKYENLPVFLIEDPSKK